MLLILIVGFFSPSFRRDKAVLTDVAENTLAPVRAKCASYIEEETLQDPIMLIEVAILWIMAALLVGMVGLTGAVKCFSGKDDPDAPVAENRRAMLLNKVNRKSLNFGLNRAGKHAWFWIHYRGSTKLASKLMSKLVSDSDSFS